LQKPAVKKLAGATELPIPVLALNQVAAAAKPSNLYQFLPIALAHGWIGYPVTRRHTSRGRPASSAWTPSGGSSVS